jgi:hypothetical protein
VWGLQRTQNRKAARATPFATSPDRRPFIPAIHEHGATLPGKGPSEVSRDASLMAEAALAGCRTYGHGLVTVGMDIYNTEAEAFWRRPVELAM